MRALREWASVGSPNRETMSMSSRYRHPNHLAGIARGCLLRDYAGDVGKVKGEKKIRSKEKKRFRLARHEAGRQWMTKVSNTSYFFLKKEKCYMSVGPHFPALKGGLWNKLGITYRRQLGSPGHRRLHVVGISRVRLGAGRGLDRDFTSRHRM